MSSFEPEKTAMRPATGARPAAGSDDDRDPPSLPSFTPGPWAAFWNEENARLHLGSWRFTHGGHHALPLMRCSEDNAKARANARLIAAAPDMLAALKSLHDDCVEYARINNLHNSDGSSAIHHSMRQAAAAIAKAEGR